MIRVTIRQSSDGAAIASVAQAALLFRIAERFFYTVVLR